ncbi:MAG: alkaline phosphatase [Gammaproteobacteria bacterium]|nr:alkaline phosphatase [Gammaproteobacteria bacterium]
MSKQLLKTITACFLPTLALPAISAELPEYQRGSNWFTEAAENVTKKATTTDERTPKTARNVILFVGDGMGISTLTAARILEGQLRGESGEENTLSFEKFPYSALIKTYNTNQQTPDSAGTMTAMMTGVKTKAGVLNIDNSGLRADCASSKGHELNTFLELMESRGRSTGIVSTARITHATPAATYARSPERNWESDSNLTDEARANGCEDIASQLINMKMGDGLDVILGGGLRHFIPKDDGGKREDNRDLTEEWKARYKGEQTARYIRNQEELASVNISQTDKLLGLFSLSHMRYNQDRLASASDEPALSEMTTTAIDLLQKNTKGYFLMVESGRIDHAHHSGNAYNALHDTLAFAKAIKAAKEKVNLEETLILVTADHSHVMTISGYSTRGNPILGKVVGNNPTTGAPEASPSLDSSDEPKPYTTLSYINGAGYADCGHEADADVRCDGLRFNTGRQDLTDIDTKNPGFHQEALVPTVDSDFISESHAGEDISLYATGAGSELVQGTQEQNTVFHWMIGATKLPITAK